VLDINDVISQSAELFVALLGQGIRISFEPEVPLWLVEIDRSQFEQILLNLAVNARDALAGKGSFVVRTHNRNLNDHEAQLSGLQQGGDFVEMQVSDSGCGIAEENLRRIFEPFFTTKPVGMGSGMGLAAVYGAVTQNGGGIRVNSTQGLGTTFTVHLPRFSPVGQ
jgi:two-component system, cell cycle sensor histidine kinase and response regulator CckA